MTRFHIDIQSARADRQRVYAVLIDGAPRGLSALRDAYGCWSAQIVGVPLVVGLHSPRAVETWLRQNVDADILSQRPIEVEI